MTNNSEELLYYLGKYQRGELAAKQIAPQLGKTEAETKETFSKMVGINESKQTLNG